MTGLRALGVRPRSVTAIRTLAGVQVAVGVAVTALAGFALIYLLVATLDIGGDVHRSLLAPVLCLIAGVLLSFALLASLARLRRANPAGRRIVLTVEVLLAAVAVIFVMTAGTRSPFVWVPCMIDLLCAVVVVTLLQTSGIRGWTGASV